ncbi:MAG: hypothetical protein A2017_12400 [Lentisphaerae bacterium GWF2_44_16]|nr:MAG: hypothetical protein A2017_12400 [Lentisphaerae bacterium GWF2_44_16]
MSEQHVVLKTIAEKCGVSIMTVSRALDPRHNRKMRASTRELILDTVKKYGYTSNLSARRLKRQKAESITLIMHDRLSRNMLSPDFDSHHEYISFSIMKGALKAAREYNYDIKFELPPFHESFQIKPAQTDGILFCTLWNMEHVIRELKKQDIPYLAIKNNIQDPDDSPGIMYVSMNRTPGVIDSFKHLYSKGHRKIGFIGTSRQISSEANRKLLRNFLLDKNIYDENLFYNVADYFDLRKLIASFNKRLPFTALVCFNDTSADLTVREFREKGLRVPQDTAVVGFDGNITYQGKGKTNLSTVAVPWEETAAEAVRTLIQKIENKDEAINFIKVLTTKFIQGETT